MLYSMIIDARTVLQTTSTGTMQIYNETQSMKSLVLVIPIRSSYRTRSTLS